MRRLEGRHGSASQWTEPTSMEAVQCVCAEGDLHALLADVAAVNGADAGARHAAARRLGRWAWLYVPAVLRPELAARARAVGQYAEEHLAAVVLPAAVLLVLGSGEAERPQRLRLGRRYLREADGPVAPVRPADLLPDRAALYLQWLRRAIRRAALADLGDRPWPGAARPAAPLPQVTLEQQQTFAAWQAAEAQLAPADALARVLAVASPVQQAVLRHLGAGEDRAQVAAALGIDHATVRVHLYRLRRKIA